MLEAAPARRQPAACDHLVEQGLQQARLADPGLARDQQERDPALRIRREQRVDGQAAEPDLVTAADDPVARDSPRHRVHHGSRIVSDRPATVIGPPTSDRT